MKFKKSLFFFILFLILGSVCLLVAHEKYNMSIKNSFKNYELKTKDGDSPFAYHLTINAEIKNAIESDNIKKYHFNLFRSLLEKTANFLGYQNWVDCINDEKRFEFVRIINLYSHGKISDLEYAELTHEEKDNFKSIFNQFLDEFKWFKEGEV